MDINEIMGRIGVQSLRMKQALDEDKKPTEYARHFDNDLRISVSMPIKELDDIKTSKDLVLLSEEKTSKAGKKYMNHFIFVDKEETLATF